MKQYILKIKDLEIPYVIKNYKRSKTIKIIFKEDIMTITKSPYVPIRDAEKFIHKNEKRIYEEYKKIFEEKKQKKSNWGNGQTILYNGEKYTIDVSYYDENIIRISIDKDLKIFKIHMPDKCKTSEDLYIKKVILQLFKKNILNILNERIPYWSRITNIKYKEFKVRDAKTKYGSCIPKTKSLHFSARLIMLKDEAIDAVIVHELCHIVHPNHSKDFYNLIENFIPNYKELDKYLKQMSKYVRM